MSSNITKQWLAEVVTAFKLWASQLRLSVHDNVSAAWARFIRASWLHHKRTFMSTPLAINQSNAPRQFLTGIYNQQYRLLYDVSLLTKATQSWSDEIFHTTVCSGENATACYAPVYSGICTLQYHTEAITKDLAIHTPPPPSQPLEASSVLFIFAILILCCLGLNLYRCIPRGFSLHRVIGDSIIRLAQYVNGRLIGPSEPSITQALVLNYSLNDRVEKLSNHNVVLQDSIVHLQGDLLIERTTSKGLRVEMAAVKVSNDGLQKECDDLKGSSEILGNSLADQKSTKDNLQEQLKAAEASNQGTQAELKAAIDCVAGLQERDAKQSQQIADSKEDLARSRAEFGALKKQIDDMVAGQVKLSAEHAKLMAELQAHNSNVLKAMEERAAQQSKAVVELQTAKASADASLIALEAAYQALLTDKHDLQGRLNVLVALESTFEAKEVEVEVCKARLQQSEVDQEELQQKVAELQQKSELKDFLLQETEAQIPILTQKYIEMNEEDRDVGVAKELELLRQLRLKDDEVVELKFDIQELQNSQRISSACSSKSTFFSNPSQNATSTEDVGPNATPTEGVGMTLPRTVHLQNASSTEDVGNTSTNLDSSAVPRALNPDPRALSYCRFEMSEKGCFEGPRCPYLHQKRIILCPALKMRGGCRFSATTCKYRHR